MKIVKVLATIIAIFCLATGNLFASAIDTPSNEFVFLYDYISTLKKIDYSVDRLRDGSDESNPALGISKKIEGMYDSNKGLMEAIGIMDVYVNHKDEAIGLLSKSTILGIDMYKRTTELSLAIFSSSENFRDQVKVLNDLAMINSERNSALKLIYEQSQVCLLLIQPDPENTASAGLSNDERKKLSQHINDIFGQKLQSYRKKLNTPAVDGKEKEYSEGWIVITADELDTAL